MRTLILQNSNKKIVKISCLKVFIASLGLSVPKSPKKLLGSPLEAKKYFRAEILTMVLLLFWKIVVFINSFWVQLTISVSTIFDNFLRLSWKNRRKISFEINWPFSILSSGRPRLINHVKSTSGNPEARQIKVAGAPRAKANLVNSGRLSIYGGSEKIKKILVFFVVN